MARYVKSISNFVIRKRHQNTKDGTIYEHDITTIGANERLTPGKRIYMRDGNFLFTISNIGNYQKRLTTGEWSDEITYDNVSDASPLINVVAPNDISDNFLDYAYYGSASDLVATTLDHIARTYPGYIISTRYPITLSIPFINEDNEDDFEFKTTQSFRLDNVFNLDLWHENVADTEVNNPLNFLSKTFNDYVIYTVDENSKRINEDFTEDDILIQDYSISYMVNKSTFWYCPQKYVMTECIFLVNLRTKHYEYTVNAYWDGEAFEYGINDMYRDLVTNQWLRLTEEDKRQELSLYLIIRPRQKYYDDFFKQMDGFEKQLLNTSTKPLYSTRFIVPVDDDKDEVHYEYKNFVYPSTVDGLLLIGSPSYKFYASSLVDVTAKMDELWCDNLYRRMTHEAIKNYDWSFTKDYTIGAEETYISGGTRVSDFLHLIGRGFDEVKHNIDGILYMNNITYDKKNNMPDSLISDKLEEMGWDCYSIIPYYTPDETIEGGPLEDDNNGYEVVKLQIDDIKSSITNTVTLYGWHRQMLNQNTSKWVKTKEEGYHPYAEHPWFNSIDSSSITTETNQIEFDRKFALSNRHIASAKGTTHAMEMIMGIFGFSGEKTNDSDYTSLLSLTKEYNEKNEEEPTSLINNNNGNYHEVDGDFDIIEEYYTTSLYDIHEPDATNKEDIDTVLSRCNRTKNISYTTTEGIDGTYGLPMEITYFPIQPTIDNAFTYEHNFLVPYYVKGAEYDGNLYFQQQGGWGYNVQTGEYKETINYTRAVHRVVDLDNFGYFDVVDGETIYVHDVTDYSVNLYDAIMGKLILEEGDYSFSRVVEGGDLHDEVIKKYKDKSYDELSADISHYFKFYKNSSFWITFDREVQPSLLTYQTSLGYWVNLKPDCAEVKYIENLINDTKGNNPHVGFDRYDNGEEYIDYLRNPYKYSIDNYTIIQDNVKKLYKSIKSWNTSDTAQSENTEKELILFDIQTPLYTSLSYDRYNRNGYDNNVVDKISIFAKTVKSHEYGGNSKNADSIRYEYGQRHLDLAKNYPINTKRITLRFNNTLGKNRYFREYFEQCIEPYLMQVIPSTAIFSVDFNYDETTTAPAGSPEKKKFSITAHSFAEDTLVHCDCLEDETSSPENGDDTSEPSWAETTNGSTHATVRLQDNAPFHFHFNVDSLCVYNDGETETNYHVPFLITNNNDWIDVNVKDDEVFVSIKSNSEVEPTNGLTGDRMEETEEEEEETGSGESSSEEDDDFDEGDFGGEEFTYHGRTGEITLTNVFNNTITYNIVVLQPYAQFQLTVGEEDKEEIDVEINQHDTWEKAKSNPISIKVNCLGGSQQFDILGIEQTVIQNVMKTDVVTYEIDVNNGKNINDATYYKLLRDKEDSGYGILDGYNIWEDVAIYEMHNDTHDSPILTGDYGRYYITPEQVTETRGTDNDGNPTFSYETIPLKHCIDVSYESELYITVDGKDTLVTTETYIDFDRSIRYDWNEENQTLDLYGLHPTIDGSVYTLYLQHKDSQYAGAIIHIQFNNIPIKEKKIYVSPYVLPKNIIHLQPSETIQKIQDKIQTYALFDVDGNPLSENQGLVPIAPSFTNWSYSANCEWVHGTKTLNGLQLSVDKYYDSTNRTALITITNDDDLDDNGESKETYFLQVEQQCNDADSVILASIYSNGQYQTGKNNSEVTLPYNNTQITFEINVTGGYRGLNAFKGKTKLPLTMLYDNGKIRTYRCVLNLTPNNTEKNETIVLSFYHENHESARKPNLEITVYQEQKPDMSMTIGYITTDDEGNPIIEDIDEQNIIEQEHGEYVIFTYPEDSDIAYQSTSDWIKINKVITDDLNKVLVIDLAPNPWLLPRQGSVIIWNKEIPTQRKRLTFKQKSPVEKTETTTEPDTEEPTSDNDNE